MRSLLNDFRHAFRVAVKSPVVSIVAVVTIALGVGANSAIFTLLDGSLLRPPFPEPDRVVAVFNRFPTLERAPASFPDFMEWRRQSTTFSGIAAYFLNRAGFTGRGEPRRVSTSLVSQGYFRILGMSPQFGRLFTPEEHREGAAPVCLISDGFWRREFRANPNILSQTATLDGVRYSIIGVLQPNTPSFSYPEKTEVWIPLEPRAPYKVHGTNYLDVVGRLKPGVALLRARAEVETIQNRINVDFPDNKHGITVYPLTEVLFGNTRPILLVLFAAAALVLLIACANLANLLLASGTARSKEFALRQALGADRHHIVRHSLTQSLFIALSGGVVGFALAPLACKFLIAIAPRELRLPDTLGLNWRIAAFSVCLVFVVALLSGVLPAVRASRVHLNKALRVNTFYGIGASGRLKAHQYFVIAEIALTTVLLAGSFLMMESLWRLVHTNPGFNPNKLLAMQISLAERRYPDSNKQARFFQQLLERIRTLPGVLSAGAITNLPIAQGGMTGDFTIEGRPKVASAEEIFASKEIVAPGYFETMNIPLIAGRVFTERDGVSGRKVAVLNQRMAKQFWPGQNPIGRRLDLGLGKENEWQEIIGIVGDVKTEGLGAPAMIAGYLCSKQYPSSEMTIVVRTANDPEGLTSALRRIVLSVDNQQPVSEVSIMNQILRESLSVSRSLGYLLSAFASIALVLAAIGVYGLVAYSVTQRTQEIGVRMALGANRSVVIAMILRMGLKLMAGGLAIGLLASASAIPLLRNQLFGIGTVDPLPILLLVSVLGLSCLSACYIPAQRAASTDPMQALKAG